MTPVELRDIVPEEDAPRGGFVKSGESKWGNELLTRLDRAARRNALP